LTKLARIEDRFREVIKEVTLYRAPNGKLYDSIEEASVYHCCGVGHA
jgi:hypothetical protein